MISYPTGLSQPSTSDGDVETPMARTELRTGLVEQEGRFATALRTTRLTWRLPEDEVLLFENWFGEELSGGVLVFGLLMARDGGVEVVPVRFVNGTYDLTHQGGMWFQVTANVEELMIEAAPVNRTPAVPLWKRMEIDPMASQVLTLSHRNAKLVTRPTIGNTTTLRIFPPTSEKAYIYFGLKQMGAGEVLITNQDVDPIPPAQVIDWPVELPVVNESFGVTAVRQASRIKMESGHVRQWARFDTANKEYSVEWEFDLEQLQTFQDFFFITLRSGAHQFNLKLPVDGEFLLVPVRFVGGQYSEAYVQGMDSRFSVKARVERIVSQTETPLIDPHPLFYTPPVLVIGNQKVYSSDAGKMFIVWPQEGETINLHIGSLQIEFGITVIGLGNVLVTRTPYFLNLSADDSGSGEWGKMSLELRTVDVNLGSFGDTGSGEWLKMSLGLVNTIRPLGPFGDTGSGEWLKMSPELLTVLEQLEPVGDTGSGEWAKLTLSLDTP